MRSWPWAMSVIGLCVCPAIASAGLIFEIDGIDAHRVEAGELTADRLAVVAGGHAYAVQLPPGVAPSLMAWARRDPGGSLVFSIDGAVVAGAGSQYSPPSVPLDLAYLIFNYDDYAHQVACGSTPPYGGASHPLVQSSGEDMLPYRRHLTLLDPATRTPEAYSYRRLPERFVRPPGCIGELTLRAVPDRGAVVSLQSQSWVTMITDQWYREIDVPSEADEWVATLPYLPLRRDMERRWSTYRAAFPPLYALSSVVEAMALLRAIKRDAPAVWTAIARGAPTVGSIARERIRPLIPHGMDSQPWRRLTQAWIGDRVDTPAQANLALGLAVGPRVASFGLPGDPSMLAIQGLEDVAARDPLTGAKLELARILVNPDDPMDPQEFTAQARRLFVTLSRIPRSFRLRAVALSRLASQASQQDLVDNGEVLELLGTEIDALQNEFLQRAESACAAGSSDLALWESLTQDVYSVSLLRWFRQHDGMLPARAVGAVACIHFHRGAAAQQGRQFAYRHAHYRFLKYLAMKTEDPRTRRQIAQYRKTLAESMSLHDWDDDNQVRP